MPFATIGQGFGVPNESVRQMLEGGTVQDGEEITAVGQVIVDSIQDNRFNSVHILVAFATSAGVERILAAIEGSNVQRVECYVGTDQQATTRQALEQLLDSEIETSTIEMRGNEVTYHPKVYLFRGEDRARVIVGSVNMTQPALEQNPEAAFIFDREEPGDPDGPISEIEHTMFDPVRKYSTPLTQPEIESLESEGTIGDETERSFSTGSSDSAASSESESTSGRTGVSPDFDSPSLSITSDSGTGSSETVYVEGDSVDLPLRESLPPLPDDRQDRLKSETDERFYNRLLRGTDNQPSKMRRLIYSVGEISQGEMKRRMVANHGYESVDAGSLDASLRVLWRITEEVEKRGQGDDATLVWVGGE